ncbi:lantibiotic modifying enzyme [Streptomyces umbrinus]|uniref:Lantibiotic modifying enzyme n=1 Tax=Streptomyces umbrinus TaxID=67370 RepID=A0ABU0TA25_9ACTN|nr:lanthionine synthetase C family protein [Streptomyces umbrinus]MDQ1031644.1 lantibiotic modifying enzyme [Streptomyces umbrinus]
MGVSPTVASPAELVDAAVRIAGRLTSTVRVAETIRSTAAADGGVPPWFWQAHGTATGFGGLAMLFGCLDRALPGKGWDRVAHEHLTAAVDSAQRVGVLPIGLSDGVTGLAFTALLLNRDGLRYRRLRRSLDQNLADKLVGFLEERRSRGELFSPDVDVISGAAGIASYLVSRPETDTLSALGAELLGWLANCVTEERLPLRPASRAVDCGLAHGLPGVVAALAVSHMRGAATTRSAAALRSGTDWLWAHRVTDRWGPNWPVDDAHPSSGPAHAAWCYGAPGVARSLLLAGRALRDTALQQAALRASTAVGQRPEKERRLMSPGFCHGTAGLAHILHRTGMESGRADLVAEAHKIFAELVAGFDADSHFGCRNPHVGAPTDNSPGLLDGAAGVAIVLLSAAGRPTPRWDRLFLIR